MNLQITDDGATVSRLAERPHSGGWTNAGANKANLPYPRIFALHDPEYLAATRIIPPFEPAPEGGDAFLDFQIAQFDGWAGSLDFSSSSNGNWLFDRSSAMFKVYMTTGRVEFLKEAFLSKQFYFNHVRNDGSSPAPAGGRGCWTYGNVSCADGKYIAPQQAKLALALVGDDSQWDDQLIVDMALQADIGWNQFGTRDPFDFETEGFTERAAGLVGLAEIVAYEMTADSTILQHLNERVTSLKDMQQTVKPWDSANGWVPKSGGFDHHIGVHEGAVSQTDAALGDTDERGFSAWMSENVADFLWQTYWITGNTDIPEMLSRLANAVDLYGFSSSYDPTLDAYTLKPAFSNIIGPLRGHSCNTTRADTSLVYMASAYASPAKIASDKWYPWYSDTHNIETVLVLAAGYHFEADESVRSRLEARIRRMIEGWSNPSCASVGSTKRLWNWQHRSNSVRTWEWVAKNAGLSVVTPNPPVGTNSAPSSPPSFAVRINAPLVIGSPNAVVYAASDSCEEGLDPHWQCAGRWVRFGDLDGNDFIGVCPSGEASAYTDCYMSDKYILRSKLEGPQGILVCTGQYEIGGGRNTCLEPRYVNSENLGNFSW